MRSRRVRTLGFRPSLAETKRRNQASLDALRIMSAREDAPVLDTGARLQMHPAVAWVARINSGAAIDERGQFMGIMRSRRPARRRSMPLAVQLERNRKAMQGYERMAVKPDEEDEFRAIEEELRKTLPSLLSLVRRTA